MSIFTTVENWFGVAAHEANVVASEVKAGFATIDNFVGEALGLAQLATAVAALTPAGAPMVPVLEAGIAGVTALRATVHAAVNDEGAQITAAGKSMMQLMAQAVTLAAQAGPFIDAVKKDVASVSETAVAAVKALPPIPATV